MEVLHCDIIHVIHVQCMVGMVMVTVVLAMYSQMLNFTDLLRQRHRAKHCH